MCPTNEQSIHACRAISKAFRFRFFKREPGLLGAFTNIKVISGVHGRILKDNDLEFRPVEVLSKWKSLISKKNRRENFKPTRVV